LGVDRIHRVLQRRQRIALDTSILIYQLETNPKYIALTDVVFAWLALPSSRAVTSTITMTEILVSPYRRSDQKLADNFYGLLSTYPNLGWIPVDLEIADLAARIRAQHHLRTPDALQAATAVQAHATAFLTNDPVFRRLANLEALILDDFV